MNRIPIIAASLVLLATLAGCAEATSSNQTPSPGYFKDQRTGICFAAVESATYYGYSVVSLTAVPCDQVPPMLLRVTEPG